MARFGPSTRQSDAAAPANTGSLSRRIFLKVAVAAGAGAGAVAANAAMAQQNGAKAAHQWAFVIDLRRCDGCAKCTTACQQEHALTKDQTWIKVYDMEPLHPHAGGRKYFMPRLCMMCENPPCVRVCPVRATYRNEEGVVLVNQNTCIGCRTCMAACPYEARYFNWEDPPAVPNLLAEPMPEFPVPQQKGTVGKCILCVHNVSVGKLPFCVQACSMEALYVADLATDVATNGRETVKLSNFLRENDAIRFREELGTRPRVWYILGHGQDLTF